MDWAEACRILGVPETAADAEIREQYLYKAQLLHPDKNQDKSESVRNKAEAELAVVNQVYAFISNPNNNPYRVPPKLAIEPLGIRFKEVGIGEKKTTTLTVLNAGGPYTSIWIDNRPAPWLTVTGVKSITNERLPLDVTLECIGTGEPGRLYAADLAIELKNEKTQAVDRTSVKIEMYTRSVEVSAGIAIPAPATVQSAGTARNRPATPLRQNKKLGFSTTTFVVNFLALVILASAVVFCLNYFLVISDMVIMAVSVVLAAATFGISFNHAITVGARLEKPKNKKN